MQNGHDIARTPAQAPSPAPIPARPNRVLSEIASPVDRWRAQVACRAYDQKYFPSKNHAADLAEAERCLARAIDAERGIERPPPRRPKLPPFVDLKEEARIEIARIKRLNPQFWRNRQKARDAQLVIPESHRIVPPLLKRKTP